MWRAIRIIDSTSSTAMLEYPQNLPSHSRYLLANSVEEELDHDLVLDVFHQMGVLGALTHPPTHSCGKQAHIHTGRTHTKLKHFDIEQDNTILQHEESGRKMREPCNSRP